MQARNQYMNRPAGLTVEVLQVEMKDEVWNGRQQRLCMYRTVTMALLSPIRNLY